MRPFALYAAACVAIIAVIGGISALFTEGLGRQAVLASAVLALVIQLLAFTVARMFKDRHVFVGWGMGSAMRFVALALYAVIVAKLWGAPVMAALLSFAAFLFVTTVIEPLFLKR